MSEAEMREMLDRRDEQARRMEADVAGLSAVRERHRTDGGGRMSTTPLIAAAIRLLSVASSQIADAGDSLAAVYLLEAATKVLAETRLIQAEDQRHERGMLDQTLAHERRVWQGRKRHHRKRWPTVGPVVAAGDATPRESSVPE